VGVEVELGEHPVDFVEQEDLAKPLGKPLEWFRTTLAGVVIPARAAIPPGLRVSWPERNQAKDKAMGRSFTYVDNSNVFMSAVV
jgi:hypothetical protein